MVVGPDEALRGIIVRESDKLVQLEKRIDGTIMQKYDGVGSVSISFASDGLRRCSVDTLLEKYHRAGWGTAEYVSDQRDGDYITLDQGQPRALSWR